MHMPKLVRQRIKPNGPGGRVRMTPAFRRRLRWKWRFFYRSAAPIDRNY